MFPSTYVALADNLSRNTSLFANQKKLQKAMASHEHKIVHLDQPFYGPPIPPESPPPAATTGAGVRPEAVAPPRRDAYALFCHAFRALTLVLIALGVVALVLWLVYQPSSLKAYVDSAQLTRFDLAVSSNGSQKTLLRYNLTVGVSIRNPNRRQAVLYRRLDAVALYGGEQLGNVVDFPRTRQARESTVEVRPSFHGQAAAAAPAMELFGREKGEGFFGIHIKLHTRVRLKVIVVDSVEYRPDVDCYIRVPDPSNATAVAQGFTPTQCHVDDFS